MSAAPSPKNDDARDEATPAASSLPSGGTWSGRFAEPMSARMQRFNASIDFDRRLAEVDIAASLAHARMLAHTNIISADDLRASSTGMHFPTNGSRSRATSSRICCSSSLFSGWRRRGCRANHIRPASL